MGFVAPRNTASRHVHLLTGAIPDLMGNVFIEPNQYIENWGFFELDGNNQPMGLAIGMPEAIEGWYLYVTEKNMGPQTLAAQNTTPIDVDEEFVVINEQWVGGHNPTPPLHAAKIAKPDPPEVAVVPRANTGFVAGPYLVTWAKIDNRGRQTTVAPAVAVTIGAGQGLRITLPSASGDDVFGVAIYMSSPNGSITTLAQQMVIQTREIFQASLVLPGPWKAGRRAPVRNETVHVVPQRPTMTTTNTGKQGSPGTYSGQIAQVDEQGREVSRSEKTDDIVLTQAAADAGEGPMIQWEDTSGDADVRYNVYINKNGEEHRYVSGNKNASPTPTPAPGKGSTGSPTTQAPRAATGSSPQGSSATGGTGKNSNVEVHTVQEKYTENKQNKENRVITSGNTTEDAPEGETGVLSPTSRSAAPSGASSGGSPQGGTSGAQEPQIEQVDPPTEPLQTPVPEGLVLLDAPGTYRVAIAGWVRDRETVVSDSVPVTLAANQTIKVTFPRAVNQVKNQQFHKVDSTGTPFDWSLTGVLGLAQNQGTFSLDNALLWLDTLGNRTGAQLSPEVSQTFPIDRSETYTFGGTLSASVGHAETLVEAVLEELSAGGAVIKTSSLKQVSQSGEVDYKRVFGAGMPDVPAQAFDDQTVAVRPKIRTIGNTRNSIIGVREFYFLNHVDRLRRYSLPEIGSLLPANPDPDPYIRWLQRAIRAVSSAPKRRRLPPPARVPIQRVDFGTSAPTFPAGWTLRQNPVSGTSAGISAGAAIDAPYGYNITKSTSNTASVYLYRTLSGNRSTLGTRVKFRLRQLPSAGEAAIIYPKHAQADAHTNGLCFISIASNGNVYAVARSVESVGWWGGTQDVFTSTLIASGVQPNDTLDIELIVLGAGSSAGYMFGAVGKNGAQRVFAQTGKTFAGSTAPAGTAIGPYNWSGLYANVPEIGEVVLSNPSATINIDLDSFVITDFGDELTDPAATVPLEPIPRPDVPPITPTYLSQLSFEGLADNTTTLPAPFYLSTPSASTTLRVQATSAIGGTRGLRVDDQNTATAVNLFAGVTFAARAVVGGKTRFRIVARPSSGAVALSAVHDAAGNVLGYGWIDSNGDVSFSGVNVNATETTPIQVADNVPNGTLLTLEVVVTGAGTSSGVMSAWASIGGTGAASERNLYGQATGIDWTGRLAAEYRSGLFRGSVVGATATVELDDIAVTTGGEVAFSEYVGDGRAINQAYAHYPVGGPRRDDLWLKDLRISVIPGATYTGAIKHRHSGVPEPCYPCFFTAYDLAGKPYPLGSLYGPNGAVGTQGWDDRLAVFTIPSADAGQTDCFEVRMTSPGITSGEFIAQELRWARGVYTTATMPREIIYGNQATIQVVLDTDAPNKPPEKWAFQNKWLDIGSVFELPAGTSASVLYGSGESQAFPDVHYPDAPEGWTQDKSLVKQGRWAHFLITLHSSPQGKSTPTLPVGSPYVEYGTFVEGWQVPTLLRDDWSEFPGGVYLDRVVFNRPKSDYEVRTPKGQTLRHRKYRPVGRINDCNVRAATNEAVEELVRYGMERDLIIESAHRRLRIRLGDPLAFEETEIAVNPVEEVWYAIAQAPLSGEKTQVVEDIPMTGLSQPDRVPIA